MRRQWVPMFGGDIAATADVNITTKGGSTNATIKKPLRERVFRHATSEKTVAHGAALEFTDGRGVVLLTEDAPVRVDKLGADRYVIRLNVEDGTEVDPVTEAFLVLKAKQFEEQSLDVMAPIDGDAWRTEMAEKRKVARERASLTVDDGKIESL